MRGAGGHGRLKVEANDVSVQEASMKQLPMHNLDFRAASLNDPQHAGKNKHGCLAADMEKLAKLRAK